MPGIIRRSVALLFVAGAAACGGETPFTPSVSTGTSGQLLAPTVFRQSTQKINPTNNEITLSWTSPETSFQIVIGTTPGSSNVLTVPTVVGNTYTWTTPRTGGAFYARVAARRNDTLSAYSDDLTLFVLDIRNVIDAMFFHAGPMADVPDTARDNPAAGIWADGSRLRVLVSTDAGETSRASAQVFADQYAALVGGAITATTEMTTARMTDGGGVTYPAALADLTIGVRVQPGFCSGALACAFYGPTPIGPNKSIVTLENATGLSLSAVAHEMGHAYGIGHVTSPISGVQELKFMMNPSLLSEQMTDAEKLAITLARNAGLRPGMTRNQALALDLVNPYTGASNINRVPASSRERRDAHGWILIDRIR